MDPRDLLIPVLLFAGSLPVFAIAWRIARGELHWVNGLDARRLADPRSVATRLSRQLATVGALLVLGAIGLYWAGGDGGRATTVVVVLLLAVNGMGFMLFRTASVARRGYLALPRAPGGSGAHDQTGQR